MAKRTRRGGCQPEGKADELQVFFPDLEPEVFVKFPFHWDVEIGVF